MKSRREFVKAAAALGLLGPLGARAASDSGPTPLVPSGADDRATWLGFAERLGQPVLGALARRQLKIRMPVEARHPAARAAFTHLEALGRVLAGLAPWLELGADATAEGQTRAALGALARTGIDAATDPGSPDFMNFAQGGQPLVDTAFLAQALVRAPTALWPTLAPRVQANVANALTASRAMQPGPNNWVLFASMVEAALRRFGQPFDRVRLFDGLRRFRSWYVGDGLYGDGAEFHWDYYNAFVIQPMLLEVLDVVGDDDREWSTWREQVRTRFTRFAAIQERLIAPDGTYPVIGRSVAYRCGAFQGLALAALRHELPAAVAPGQARAALTSVIRRTLEPAGTFDERGWLRIGVSGHQPALGEDYISTGSLYLCAAALLPLGLPAHDPFWNEPAAPTTGQRIWSGADVPADHALRDTP